MTLDLRSSFVFLATCGAASSIALAQSCGNHTFGSAQHDHLGWAIAAIGDLDADGATELAVGAPQASNPVTGGGATGPGYVQVRSGRTGALLGTIVGVQSGELFGWSLAAFADTDGDSVPDASGDVTGDGVPDLLVGAPWHDGANPREGRVYVVSGASLAIVATIANPTPSTGARFGHTLSAVGNTTGDGRSEFAVGAPFWSATGGGTAGHAHLYGWAAGVSPALLATTAGAGSSAGTEFGYTVRGIGDASGDGIRDVLVSENGTQRVFVLSTAAFAITANLAVISAPATATGATFGWTLCGLGDLDANGAAEFAIGSPQCATGSCTAGGFVQVRSLTAGVATLRQTLQPVQRPNVSSWSPAVRFGAALATARDLDGDGLRDLVVGSPAADPRGTNSGSDDAGEVHVFAGSSLIGGPPRRLVVLDGESGEQAGSSVCGLGDVDGDGVADLAVASVKAMQGSSSNVGRLSIVRHAGYSRLLGDGCAAASTQAPEFHVASLGGPCRGDTVRMQMPMIPANSLCVLALGLTAASFPGVPRPGCTVHLLPVQTFGVLPGNQTFATASLTIPNHPALAGSQFFWQWLALGAAFPATASTRPSLRLTIR
jgi:hypothetical protein